MFSQRKQVESTSALTRGVLQWRYSKGREGLTCFRRNPSQIGVMNRLAEDVRRRSQSQNLSSLTVAVFTNTYCPLPKCLGNLPFHPDGLLRDIKGPPGALIFSLRRSHNGGDWRREAWARVSVSVSGVSWWSGEGTRQHSTFACLRVI